MKEKEQNKGIIYAVIGILIVVLAARFLGEYLRFALRKATTLMQETRLPY